MRSGLLATESQVTNLSYSKILLVVTFVSIVSLTFFNMPHVSGEISQFSNPINISKLGIDTVISSAAISGNSIYSVWVSKEGTYQIYFSKIDNNGATLITPTNISHNLGDSLSPKIAISGNNVYTTWGNRSSANIFLQKSTDGGATFNNPINIGQTGSIDHTSIAVLGNNVFVVWQGYHKIMLVKSTDNGITFSMPIAIVNASSNNDIVAPHILVSNNTLYLIYDDTANNGIGFVKSTDNGATFSTPIYITSGITQYIGGDDDMAVAGNNVYIVSHGTNGNSDIFLAKSTDNGVTFNPTLKMNIGNFEWNPKISSIGNAIYVVWFHNSPPDYKGSILFTKSTDNGVTFSAPVNVSTNLGYSFFPQVLSSNSGNSAYVLWSNHISDNSNNQVFFSKRLIAHAQNVTANEDQATQVTLTSEVDNNPTYSYSIVNPPNHGTLTGVSPTLTYLPNKYYYGNDSFTFKTSLTDSNTATVSISVARVNYPPVANAGTNNNVKPNTMVTLDGSASMQPNGDVLTYSWIQTSGIPVTLSDKSTVKPTFTAPSVTANSILTFVVTVTDGISSKSDTSSVTITVQPLTQNNQNTTVTPPTNNNVSVPTISNTGITVSTDKSSYNRGDTITISSKLSSHVPNQSITIRVLNGFQNPVDIALLAPAPDGSVTTKLLATGPLWQTSGTYTIMAQYNSTVKTLTAFYFNAGNGTASANNVTNAQSTPSLDELLKQRMNDAQRLQELLHPQNTTTNTSSPQSISISVFTPTQQEIQNINQVVAAEVNIGTNKTETKSIDNNVLVQTTQTTPDSLGVEVSATNQTGPKVIAFNLAVTTVNVQNLKDLGVIYDGKLIQPAPNMDAILHAKPTDNPSFVIVVTQSGVQVLVLVPHFSTHTITITNMSKVIPVVPEFGSLATIVLIIATFSIILIPKIKQIQKL
ncbi:MAG: hypothetical protein KGI19_10210 [Thaumarchaeota archaeon]|nr:hypothetical protein [Nitrososphaerota archaeon]